MNLVYESLFIISMSLYSLIRSSIGNCLRRLCAGVFPPRAQEEPCPEARRLIILNRDSRIILLTFPALAVWAEARDLGVVAPLEDRGMAGEAG